MTDQTSNKANANAMHPGLQAWLQRNRVFCEISLDAYCIVDTANRGVEVNTGFTERCGESCRKVLKSGDFCSLVKTGRCPDGCPARDVITNGKAIRLDELI